MTYAVPPQANWLPSKAGDMRGAAANISGNGEKYAGQSEWLQMKAGTSEAAIDKGESWDPNRTPAPAVIRVGGDWNEEWTLQPDGIVKNYKSPAWVTRVCGPSLEAFNVTSANDVSGTGIRCVWRAMNIWYGEGQWKGTAYAHVGTGGGPGINGIAADICDLSRFKFCNFANGTLMINPYLPAGGPSFPHVKIEVRGGWAEDWLPR